MYLLALAPTGSPGREDFCDDDALKVDGWVGLVGYDPWVGGGLVGAGCAGATFHPPRTGGATSWVGGSRILKAGTKRCKGVQAY